MLFLIIISAAVLVVFFANRPEARARLRRALQSLPPLTPLREFAHKARGFSDLLPYAMKISPDTTLNTDGSLTTSYRYHGQDMESSSGRALAYMSDRFNDAIRRLDESWNLQFHSERRLAVGYPIEGAFPDPTSWIIDEERRVDYEDVGAHYINDYSMDLTWLPPPDSVAKSEQWMIEGEQSTGSAAAARDAEKNYRQILTNIEGMIGPDLNLEKLTQKRADCDEGTVTVDEQLQHFIRCATGKDIPIVALPPDHYLSPIVGAVSIRNGFRLRVGDSLVAVLTIEEMPSHIMAGVMDVLNQLPCEYRASWRFIVRNREAALKDIELERSRWYARRRSMADAMNKREAPIANIDAISMAQDAAQAAAECRSDESCFGYFTASIVFWQRIDRSKNIGTLGEAKAEAQMEDDAWRQLVASTDMVAAQINRRGFVVRFERENVLEAFLGTLPAIGYANLRRPMLSSRNLADFIPLTSVWAGEPTAPCPFYPPDSPPLAYVSTTGSTPFALNLHCSDVGHTLLAGETGAGKSTALGTIAAQHRRYSNSRQILFDVGRSHYALTMGVGGSHYDVGGESSLKFCPLQYIGEQSERLWAEGWIMGLLKLRGISDLHEKRAKVFKALEYMARSEPPYSLSKFLIQPFVDSQMREALEYYTISGSTDGLLDAEEESIDERNFVCFEMGHLMETPADLKAPVLQHLIHRVERSLTGQPTLLILDEVWRFLEDEQMIEAIRRWLKVMRKLNVAVVFATQTLSDLTESPIGATLIGSCPTKIFLPNPSAQTEFASKAYRQLGLSSWQIRQIARATSKRDYYIVKPYGKRMIQLGLKEISLAFIGVSDKKSIEHLQKLIESERVYLSEHPQGDGPTPWQARWLEERIPGDLGKAWSTHWLAKWKAMGGRQTLPQTAPARPVAA